MFWTVEFFEFLLVWTNNDENIVESGRQVIAYAFSDCKAGNLKGQIILDRLKLSTNDSVRVV